MTLLLLALLFLRRQRPGGAGVVFACALAVKVAAVIVAPAILFGMLSSGYRKRFLMAATATSAVLWAPALVVDARNVVNEVFLYRSFSAIWGLGRFFNAASVDTLDRVLVETWAACAIAAVIAVGYFAARTGPLGRERAVSASFLTFLALTPGFGIQYLAWPTVFLVIIAPTIAAVYSGAAGACLYVTYSWWSGGGWTLGYANSWAATPGWSLIGEATKDTVWVVAVGILLWLYWTRHTHGLPDSMTSASRQELSKQTSAIR
jgi:hypothetical protein